jgi:hypothetical protein
MAVACVLLFDGRMSRKLASTFSAVVTFSGYSLVLTGWITIPAGALLGRWHARWR